MHWLTWSWAYESHGSTVRIIISIGELLLIIYKFGFYRWEKKNMTHSQTTSKNRIVLRVGKKFKLTIRIATFNVRTLNRIGQIPELTASAVEHNIDIICIQEHIYTHSNYIKYHDTGNGYTLATVSARKNSFNATVGGTIIFINTKSLKIT